MLLKILLQANASGKFNSRLMADRETTMGTFFKTCAAPLPNGQVIVDRRLADERAHERFQAAVQAAWDMLIADAPSRGTSVQMWVVTGRWGQCVTVGEVDAPLWCGRRVDVYADGSIGINGEQRAWDEPGEEYWLGERGAQVTKWRQSDLRSSRLELGDGHGRGRRDERPRPAAAPTSMALALMQAGLIS